MFFFMCLFVKARVFYVATNGNDSLTVAEAQNIATPWQTLGRACSSGLLEGDTVYVRGGTYLSTGDSATYVHFSIESLTGTSLKPIKIWAYPGERPVFNLGNITPSYSDPKAFLLFNCAYVHIKGIRIINLKQKVGGIGISRGFTLNSCNHCTIEFVEIDNIGGSGFKIESSFDNLLLNCDAHHIGDGLSDGGIDAWDNSDGFSCTGGDSSSRNTFDGCRAWLCSDDGWDFLNTNGINTLKNCWSFWNGYKPWGPSSGTVGIPTVNNPAIFQNDSNYIAGNGEGFKLGPASVQQINVITKFLNNCLSFENRGRGYSSNSDSARSTQMEFYNNIAYKNDNDGWSFGTGWSVGIAHIFKNNWSWNNNQKITGNDFVYDGLYTNISNNSWDNIASVNNTDFINVSSVGVDGPRQTNGNLPFLNYLKLSQSSDLINAGLNVGLIYYSLAPDLGAFEFIPLPVQVTLTAFTAAEKTGKTLLQWATVTEINSSHFEVERSNDARNYESIGTVNARRNSNTRIDYQLTDYYPSLGVNYYRLKIADKNGQYEYSKIVSINFRNNDNTGSFEIQSAIINNKTLQLNVSSSKQQSGVLGLYDDVGRAIFVSDITLQKAVNNINKVITSSGAVYYLKLKTNDKSVTLPLFNEQ